MTVRLPPEVSDKLEALARDTKRSKSYLAGEAIASYVEMNAWQVARIKAERQVIQLALTQSNGTIAAAAKLLGISRPTLYSLLEEHGIEARPVRAADEERNSTFSETHLQ